MMKKQVLVTGGTGGIGEAIVRLFDQKGYAVHFTTRKEEQGRRLVSQCSDAHMLLGDLQEVDKLLPRLPQPVHILVHNAGMTRDNLLLRMKEEDWREVFQVNVDPLFFLTKAVLRGMLKERWGRIILISSVAGLMGNAGQVNYAAAKAAMVGFAKSLAREVGSRNITVNVVAPGIIATPMTAQLPEETLEAMKKTLAIPRLGTPEEVAYGVAFLASEEAGYITGSVLNISGGLYM